MSTTTTRTTRALPDVIRILHVDDEPAFTDVAATFLEREDERFEIVTAASADAGLDRLAEDTFDCVVSDYDMAGRNGIEFLRDVRAEYPDLPFILFTGKGSEEVASDAIVAGATDYLQKEPGTGQYELLANRITNAVSQAQSQQAERHLRELAENTDRILYIFSQDWKELLFINSAYEDIWARSVDTLRANPTDFLNGVHPDDRDTVRDAMEQMSGGETIETEIRVNADEDFERWVRVRGEPITDETGAVARVAGFATDITDRKQLQQTLRKRTERLEEAQQVAGVGSWEWDVASDTVVWSDETYRIFGWDPDEPSEPAFDDWFAAVHPADREEVGALVERAMETGSFPTFEHRVRTPDDGVKWVKCRGDVKHEDGDLVGITGTVLDITDSIEYEQTLEYQQSVLESVIETLPQGILVVDDDREIFTYNERFVEMWDLPDDAIERGDDQGVLAGVLDTLERPDEFIDSVEYVYDNPDATGHDQLRLVDGRILERFTAPATDEHGTYFGRIWVFQDITEREERERTLQQERDRLDKFASVVSHDLQNPLTVAEGRLELARDDCHSDHLDSLETALHRMDRIIENVHTMARSGRQIESMESVVVRDAVESAWTLVTDGGDRAEVRYADEDFASTAIAADADRFHQLLENLFHNAVEHGGEGVTITVGDLPDGLYVEDDGPGIPEGVSDDVFDPGYSTAEDGTGFGLYIVKQIAEAHGWTVRVSEGSDGGARFEITGVTDGT